MEKNKFKLYALYTLIVIIGIFLIRFFFFDLSIIAEDIDRNVNFKYEYSSDTTKVASTLLGFVVYDEDGMHFAKTAISGKNSGIKVLKENKSGKYYVVFNSFYSTYSKFKLMNELKTFKIPNNEKVITMDTIRNYTEADPKDTTFYYDGHDLVRIVAPNEVYKKLDTMDVVFFEYMETINDCDAEIYYDDTNTYYVITPYSKNDLEFLNNEEPNCKVQIPEYVDETKIKETEEYDIVIEDIISN